jgi:hypothetical protein
MYIAPVQIQAPRLFASSNSAAGCGSDTRRDLNFSVWLTQFSATKPEMPRCFGPTHAVDFGLRVSVEDRRSKGLDANSSRRVGPPRLTLRLVRACGLAPKRSSGPLCPFHDRQLPRRSFGAGRERSATASVVADAGQGLARLAPPDQNREGLHFRKRRAAETCGRAKRRGQETRAECVDVKHPQSGVTSCMLSSC